MSEEEVESLRLKAKIGMKKTRAKFSEEEKEKVKKDAQKRMMIHRKKHAKVTKDTKSQEETEYDVIVEKYRKIKSIKETRNKRTEEQYLSEKAKAKTGMKEFRDHGSLRNFSERSKKNTDEIEDWKEFVQKGDSFKEIVESKKPDLIERLNKEIREEKEREREKKKNEQDQKEKAEKKRKEGIWEYNGESGEYYWTGLNEPEKIMDTCIYKPLTEEEKKLSEEAEALHFKWWSEERAKERKEKRRQRYQEYKERMAIPIDPLPKTELCPYEQLRENNIKEREEAMRKCGFFRDLENTKKEIGLVKDNLE